MRSSRAEITIEEILTMAGIDFKEEFTFSDLISTSGRPLRFDFCIFDNDGEIDFLIEYQGKQHYLPSAKYGGSKGLYQQKYNDNMKRKYCQLHGYNLVEIPYWDEGKLSYDYIMRAANGW